MKIKVQLASPVQYGCAGSIEAEASVQLAAPVQYGCASSIEAEASVQLTLRR